MSAEQSVCVGISKKALYETPYNVTGIIKRIGSEMAPKSVCTDRCFGTWKVGNADDKGNVAQCCGVQINLLKRSIKALHSNESEAIVPMMLPKGNGGMGFSRNFSQ